MVKKIQIGEWDSDLKEVVLTDEETIADALKKAEIAISKAQSIISAKTASNVDISAKPDDNEVYFITSNIENGYN